MQIRTLLLLAGVATAGALATACSNASPAVTSPTAERPAGSTGSLPLSGSCSAEAAQWTIGQEGSKDLLERARVAAKATVARFLLPNQPITLEYLASRLNLELDGKNLVRSARCG